ncbi:hypothetical protein BHYA_0307g00020 [Botrytis hyacinthi]|uniref:Uncharacterized protein n=1 Tax=Botrytis hyacinthi TaxID=278943 RepID=A0A4Z1GBS0_9HELO|nr:hypothetical protein BHYA_0307g00020 [Botrytis hyacinthi]
MCAEPATNPLQLLKGMIYGFFTEYSDNQGPNSDYPIGFSSKRHEQRQTGTRWTGFDFEIQVLFLSPQSLGGCNFQYYACVICCKL